MSGKKNDLLTSEIFDVVVNLKKNSSAAPVFSLLKLMASDKGGLHLGLDVSADCVHHEERIK